MLYLEMLTKGSKSRHPASIVTSKEDGGKGGIT